MTRVFVLLLVFAVGLMAMDIDREIRGEEIGLHNIFRAMPNPTQGLDEERTAAITGSVQQMGLSFSNNDKLMKVTSLARGLGPACMRSWALVVFSWSSSRDGISSVLSFRRFLPWRDVPCHVLPCPVLSCVVLFGLVLCQAMACHVMSGHVRHASRAMSFLAIPFLLTSVVRLVPYLAVPFLVMSVSAILPLPFFSDLVLSCLVLLVLSCRRPSACGLILPVLPFLL